MHVFRSPKWWKEFHAEAKKNREIEKAQAEKAQAEKAQAEKAQASSNEELEGLKRYVKNKKKPI